MMENGPIQPLLETTPSPRLSTEELEALVAMEEACYAPETCYSLATIRGFLDWEGSQLVRAHAGDRLAGFQMSNLISGQLITLDVHPEFRRKGIGSAILERTLSVMRRQRLPLAQCEIAVDNEPSIQLHKNFGFQTLGRIEGYYEDGSDALLMVLLLSVAARGKPR